MTPEERWARIEQPHEVPAHAMELLAISHEATERTLRRAIHLAVQEARNQRKRRRELDARTDEMFTRLAAAQLITEEKIQHLDETVKRFFERQSGKGNPPNPPQSR